MPLSVSAGRVTGDALAPLLFEKVGAMDAINRIIIRASHILVLSIFLVSNGPSVRMGRRFGKGTGRIIGDTQQIRPVQPLRVAHLSGVGGVGAACQDWAGL